MPAQVIQIRIFPFQRLHQQVDLVLKRIAVHHHIFFVVVVTVAGLLGVMVAGGLCGLLVFVVGCCVHQNIQAGFSPGGYRDYRNAQHFRQAVQVNFHAPLLHNVHHVQRQNNRLSQLNQL